MHMYTISSTIVSPFGFLINDKPASREQDMLAEYLSDAKRIFQKECDTLLSVERTFTGADAERLSGMLKLLLDARSAWQEEAVEVGM